MRHGFSKSQRLLQRREFQAMRSSPHRRVGKHLIIDFRPNSLPFSRLGITVSKKFGLACKRNRFKRLTREAFRLSLHKLPAGIDFHIRPKHQAFRATRDEIVKDFLGLNH